MLTLFLPLEGNQIELKTDNRKVQATVKGCTLQEVEEILQDITQSHDPFPQPKGNRLLLEAVGLRCQLEFPNLQAAQWAVQQLAKGICIQWETVEEFHPEEPEIYATD